ncbi:hypothetical protein Hanom_Chr16g01509451 [Helianthus anomalus]
MSPRVKTRHGEVTAELAWSGSGSRSEITPKVGRTVHLPPPPPNIFLIGYKRANEGVMKWLGKKMLFLVRPL